MKTIECRGISVRRRNGKPAEIQIPEPELDPTGYDGFSFPNGQEIGQLILSALTDAMFETAMENHIKFRLYLQEHGGDSEPKGFPVSRIDGK